MSEVTKGYISRPSSMSVPIQCSIFFAALFVFFATSHYQINLYDEGIILTGAFRILHGEWPSRDFYANYGPGQFFVVAALFKLLGMTAVVSRTYDAVISAAIVLLVYRSVRDARPMLVAGAVLITTWVLVSYRVELYTIMPCLLLFLAGGIATARHLSKDAHRIAHQAWAISAVIFMFRFDLGVAAAFAFGVSIAVVALADCAKGRVDGRTAITAVISNAAAALAWVSIAALLLWLVGILVPSLEDLSYMAENYVRMRSMPFPGFGDLARDPVRTVATYYPVAVVMLAVVAPSIWRQKLASAWLNRDEYRSQEIGIIVFISVTVISYLKGYVRVSPEHLLVACVSAIILLVMVVDAATEHVREPNRALRLSLVVALFATVLVTGNTVQARWIADQLRSASREGIPASIFPFGSRGEAMDAAKFIASNTLPNERILSVTGRHDKIFANDVSIYFMAQRLPGTRWHHFDPGVQTTEQIQAEMIEDIQRNKVRFIFQDRSFDAVDEKNGSAVSSGVTILDKYIAAHFREVRRFGEMSVLQSCEGCSGS